MQSQQPLPPPQSRTSPVPEERDAPADGRRKRSATTKAQERDHSGDEEFIENEHELFCVCQQPFNVDTAMIECDQCNEWYHLKCVGLTQVPDLAASFPLQAGTIVVFAGFIDM